MFRSVSIAVLLCGLSVPALAQVAPFNEAGIAAGHEHLVTANPGAHAAFWTAIGGIQQPMAPGGTTQIIKFPGIVLMAQGARGRGAGGRGAAVGGAPAAGAPAATPPPAGAPAAPAVSAPPPPAPPQPPAPSVGSSVEALSFRVRSLPDTLAKLAALGIQPMAGATASHAFVMSPDNLKVGLIEDTSLPTPAAAAELLMKVPNVGEAAAWYAKWFGARIVAQGSDTVAEIPGVNIRFAETKDPVAPTQGRALDHIGFEVRNLEALMTRMVAEGVNVTSPYRAFTAIPPLTSLAFIVDPWGTRIELNEGFKDVR